MPPFCIQGLHVPPLESFLTKYLAELHFVFCEVQPYEIGLLISSLHEYKGAVPCGRKMQSRKRTANYRKALDFFLLQGFL